MITQNTEAFALMLYQIGAIKFGAFKLKLHEITPDAPLSPVYIDLRILRSFPDAMDSAINIYKDLIAGIKYDVLADIPTAATPIVAILSYRMRVPMISPRLEKKKHGAKTPIDGSFKEGQVALLIDDLVTLADTKLEAAAVLEENGLTVNDIAVLLDREQGGLEELRRRGYACHAAFKLKELLDLYLNSMQIDEEQYGQIMAYLESSAF